MVLTFTAALVAAPDQMVEIEDAELAVRAAYAKKTKLFMIGDALKKAFDDRIEMLTKEKVLISNADFDLYRRVAESPKPTPEHPFRRSCLATSAVRDEFFRAMYANVWPALIAFRDASSDWSDDWTKAGNAAAALGKSKKLLKKVPNAIRPPPTHRVVDAALAVSEAFTEALAGARVIAARDAAYEAQRVVDLLDLPGLPKALGCEGKPGVLRLLGAGISTVDKMLEDSLVKYAMRVLSIARDRDAEPYALAELVADLGDHIAWRRIGPSDATPTAD
jgi:hypothetical protein